MFPRLSPGDYVLSFRQFRWKKAKPGQMFVLSHPVYGEIVKTLASVDEEDSLWFCGENAESVSADNIGAITPTDDSPIYRVIYVIRPSLKWAQR
ncbi:S24/S26 family peptidase [Veronia nyctiphanis]|nr:S24/S26 family peptidase [Veronia nyctiphanis]